MISGSTITGCRGDYQWDPTSKIFDIIAPGVDAKLLNTSGGLGTGDMTLQDFGQLYWNYTGTSSSNATKAPGSGNVVAWANAVHLNDGIKGNLIILADLSAIKTNIHAQMQHCLAIGNGVDELRLSVFN
jgi:hypothetical protein